jgi:hypothetical protein
MSLPRIAWIFCNSRGVNRSEAILRPEFRRHTPKISMSAYSAEEQRGVERIAHQVTLTLFDGRIF